MSGTAGKYTNALGAGLRALRLASLAWIAVAAQTGCMASADVSGPERSGGRNETSASGDDTGAVIQGADKISTRIYGGERDNDGEAEGSVVALRIGTGSVFELCTGALVAPNLVLTARHCISKNIASTVICDEHGKSGNGDHVGADIAISTISVYTGANPKFADAPAARAAELVHEDTAILCDRDIAFVVLDRTIDFLPIAKMRAGRTLEAGESVRSIGYGKNDMSLPTGTRIRRPNIPVLAVGQAVSANKTPLALHEFEVGLSTCQGDSGGPAVSELTGAVVGVVSRGGNCDDNFGHIYTSTSGHAELFLKAFDLAGAKPQLEPGDSLVDPPTQGTEVGDPAPRPKAGTGCATTTSAPGAGAAFALLACATVVAVSRRRRAR